MKPKQTLIIVNSISLLIILLSYGMILLLYLANRSLWVDEAMLAYSFGQRNLASLVTAPFEWHQIAPIPFLYIVKLLTLILGYSEFSLRLFSLFAFTGTLILAYLLLKETFLVSYPLLGVAYLASTSLLIYYANEFKPYMGDCFFVLLTLYLFHLFENKKINLPIFTFLLAVLVWFSLPVIFFAGGISINNVLRDIRQKRVAEAIKPAMSASVVLASFVLHYLVWLEGVSNSDFMLDYWENYFFPLLPRSFDDLILAGRIAFRLVNRSSLIPALIAVLFVLGLLLGRKSNKSMVNVVVIGYGLVLLASALHKYPITSRLILFSYPIVSVIAFVALDRFNVINLKSMNTYKSRIVFILTLAVFIGHLDAVKYMNVDNRYIENEEAKQLISYLEENVQVNDKIYVYHHTVPLYSFVKGYSNLHIGEKLDKSIHNVFLGTDYFVDGNNIQEMDIIASYKRCYLLISHFDPVRLNPLFEHLKAKGNISIIYEFMDTPLYLFERYN